MANYKPGLKGSGTFYNGEIKSDEGILNKDGKDLASAKRSYGL